MLYNHSYIDFHHKFYPCDITWVTLSEPGKYRYRVYPRKYEEIDFRARSEHWLIISQAKAGKRGKTRKEMKGT